MQTFSAKFESQRIVVCMIISKPHVLTVCRTFITNHMGYGLIIQLLRPRVITTNQR